MTTRLLFLDDSGKPELSHPSRAVVLGGLSIPSVHVPVLARRLLGAKAKFFPNRGQPAEWELKSIDFVRPNPWKRRKNRDFVQEMLRIVGGLGCTLYSVGFEKSQLKHPLKLETVLPLHRGVYFAASHTSEALQVADLVSGVRRRHIEGDASMAAVAHEMDAVCNVSPANGASTHTGREFRNRILLFR